MLETHILFYRRSYTIASVCIPLLYRALYVMVDRDWIALAGFDDILSVDREPSKANLNIPPELGQQDLNPDDDQKRCLRISSISKKLNDFGTMPGSRFYHQRLSSTDSAQKKTQ